MSWLKRVFLISLAALATFAPTSVEAQRRHTYGEIHRRQTYYSVPGSSTRIYGPRRVYHYGGITVYPSNGWHYGYPPGYTWPYGNTRTFYSFPRYRHYRR